VAREQLALAWPRYASWWRDLLAEGTPSDTIAWNSRSHPRQIISPRAGWKPEAGGGKGLVGSADLGRELREVLLSRAKL